MHPGGPLPRHDRHYRAGRLPARDPTRPDGPGAYRAGAPPRRTPATGWRFGRGGRLPGAFGRVDHRSGTPGRTRPGGPRERRPSGLPRQRTPPGSGHRAPSLPSASAAAGATILRRSPPSTRSGRSDSRARSAPADRLDPTKDEPCRTSYRNDSAPLRCRGQGRADLIAEVVDPSSSLPATASPTLVTADPGAAYAAAGDRSRRGECTLCRVANPPLGRR